MLEPHQHLGFWCLPQKLPGFPQELRWRARSEAPAGCTGEQLYLADAGPPEVVIYIITANAWVLPGPAMTTGDASLSSSTSSNPY